MTSARLPAALAAARSPRLRGAVLAAAGALALFASLSRPATVQGELLAVLAALAACLGWGTALSRLLSPPASPSTSPSASFSASPSASPSSPIAPPPRAALLEPEPAAARTVLGLAFLLVLGALLAHLGLASRSGLLALLGAGLLAGLVTALVAGVGSPAGPLGPLGPLGLASAAPSSPPAYSWPQLAVIACGMAFLVVVELFDLSPVLGDRRTHSFAVARLWQLSELPAGPGLLGGQTIGQALFALGGDARSAGLFDVGVCTALLVALLASACARPRLAQGFLLLAVLALPVVFFRDSQSAPTARWTATLLLFAGGLRLRRAVALATRDRGVLLLAAALVAVRGELALPATVLALAGLILPRGLSANRTKRATALGLFLLWIWPLALALSLAGAPLYLVPALAIAAGLGLAVAHLLVVVCRLAPWRDEVSFAIAATLGTALLSAARLAGGLQQATFPVWFAMAALALTRAFIIDAPVEREADAPAEREADGQTDGEPHRSPTAAAPSFAPLGRPLNALLLFTVLSTALVPVLEPYRYQRSIRRMTKVVHSLSALGLARAVSSGAAELQARVPAGARLGFWGENPTGLDFRRNPITDVSWADRPRTHAAFLAPLSPERLATLDYLLVAGAPSYLPPSSWHAPADPAAPIAELVEPVAESRSAKLFRVRAAAPRAPQLQ